MPWEGKPESLYPAGQDRVRPAVFSVPGRSAVQVFAEFQKSDVDLDPKKQRDLSALIEAKLGHRRHWQQILAFTFRIQRVNGSEQYIPYSHGLDVDQ